MIKHRDFLADKLNQRYNVSVTFYFTGINCRQKKRREIVTFFPNRTALCCAFDIFHCSPWKNLKESSQFPLSTVPYVKMLWDSLRYHHPLYILETELRKKPMVFSPYAEVLHFEYSGGIVKIFFTHMHFFNDEDWEIGTRWGIRHGNRLLCTETMVRHPSRMNPATHMIEDAVITKKKERENVIFGRLWTVKKNILKIWKKNHRPC